MLLTEFSKNSVIDPQETNDIGSPYHCRKYVLSGRHPP